MANIMTKRGQLDNVVTYQHFCDTTADLANIESKYCTLGSIAIVLQGDSGGLQIYIANSDKQWNPLTSGIGGGNGDGVANLPLEIVNPSNDDVLAYDSTSEKWVNKAATNGGSSSFDPDITNPQDGDTLVYDESEQKWVNGSGGGSGGGYLKVGYNSETDALDKTWKEIHDALLAGYYVVLTDEMMGMVMPSQFAFAYHPSANSYTAMAYGISPDGALSTTTYVTDSENGYPVVQE